MTYHWESTRTDGLATQAMFNLDDTKCRGYAEQFRRKVELSAPLQPSGGSGAGGAYAAFGDASNAYYAQLTEQNRIRSIYDGCMAGEGWQLVPDTLR
jgi:hypothetical protein